MTAEEIVDLIAAEAVKKYADCIKQYCEEHKSCYDCTFFNGTCRINNLPSNWDIYTTKYAKP